MRAILPVRAWKSREISSIVMMYLGEKWEPSFRQAPRIYFALLLTSSEQWATALPTSLGYMAGSFVLVCLYASVYH
jgi:hypothetical protein